MDTETVPEVEDVPEFEPTTRGRRRALVIATVATAIVIGGLAWAWHWRTSPDAFSGAGNAVGMTLDRSRTTVYFGIIGGDSMDADGVTIDTATPQLIENSARAGFAFYLCDLQRNKARIGVAVARNFDSSCANPVPVVGETRFGPDQYLVMSVTVHRPGLVRTRGVDLTYADGWQHGTQTIGPAVRVDSR